MKKITSKTLIFIATFMSFVVSDRSSQAQISSDGTLPTNVRRSGNAFEITGGSQAGGNLFHSFKEFSVPRGGEAFFKNATNASNVNNIISRVTGGSISNIDGLIRENYGANFILINPSGINFGANARLQIGGSFLASTADNLKFADETVFSATNPQAEPLLTVSVPVGLQFGQNPAPIRVQNTGHNLSFGNDGRPPIERPNPLPAGLSVPAGQTLALVGGNLTFDGGIVRTGELGTIELGSVGQGQVSLNSVSNSPGWRLGYEGISSFGNIQFNSASLVDASGVVGGSIRLQGAQIEIAEGSAVLLQNLGNVNAGKIEINASESLELRGVSPDDRGFVSTISTGTFGSGKGGNVTITAPKLEIVDGGRVGTITFGSGDGGELNVTSEESVFVNGSSPAIPGNFSILGTLSIDEGNSGNFSLSTKNLTVSNGGIVSALAFGAGDAGDLRIDASNSILIKGVAPDFPSSVGSFSSDAGNAGDAIVNTRQLIARDGGRLITASFGSGGGGNLTLNASDSLSIIGEAPGFSSVVGSFSSSAGEAGNTTVTTKKAVIRNGGGLVSATFGAGNGGDLTLNASESVEVSGIGVTNSSRSIISAGAIVLFDEDPLPSGNAGDLIINSERVSLSRGAQITTANLGRGDAGNIRINAGAIFMSDRAGITAATLPNIGGRGGSIALQARNSIQAHNNSQISNSNGGAQAAGNLTIDTSRLIFTSGSFAATTTFGQGAGGNLIVRASESVELAGEGFGNYQEIIEKFINGNVAEGDIGNGLFTGTSSSGRAGNLTIETQQLNLREGAFISTSTFGTGKGGNIALKADRGVDMSGSGIASTTSTISPAGRVRIDTSNLTLRDGGAIVTATLGDGRGGDLTINAIESVELSNTPVAAITPTGMFTNSVNGRGRAGDLSINTQRLVVRDGSGISTQSGGLTRTGAIAAGGAGGNLTINATEGIELVGISPDGRFESTLNTATFTASPAGNIDITTGKLSVRDGAIVGASTIASGSAGDVKINASEFVEVTGTSPRSALPLPEEQSRNPSTIASSANIFDGRLFGRFSLPSGKSGDVTINTDRLRVSDGALITTSNDGRGLSGNIDLDARSIVIENAGAITAELGGTNRFGRPIFFSPATDAEEDSKGGTIDISAEQLALENVGEISTSTFTNVSGGDILIDASESLIVNGFSLVNPRLFSSIGATTFGSGNSGNINIATGRLAITNRGSVTAGTLGTGSGGNVTVNATQSVEVSGGEPTEGAPSLLAVSTFNRGNAGNMRLDTPKLIVREGGRIDSSALAQGSAGSITINASDSVEVSGTTPGRGEASQITAGANIESEIVRDIFNLPDAPSGTSGNVNINTERLIVSDGAQINVRNEGSGNAGTLKIDARSVSLDNDGNLTAATRSGLGGNIDLQVRDSLQMRRGSQISAQAGGTSQGGNITINASALLLFENSNIFANALQGRGGNIDISTQGLFQCADCQISAASEVGLDGVVEVFTPDVDTNLEVLDVPEQVTQPEEVVALACAAAPRQTRSEFTITGRGGLPPRPSEALSSEALVSFGSPATEATPTGTTQAKDASLPPPARGWYVSDRGTVVLAAQAPAASPYSSGLTSQNCRSK